MKSKLLKTNSSNHKKTVSKRLTKSKSHTLKKKDDLIDSTKLTCEGDFKPSERKYDCCAFVIYCSVHQKVATSKLDECSIVWLPFTPMPTGRSWTEGAQDGALTILSAGIAKNYNDLKDNLPFNQVQCMQVLRLQLPQTLKFVTRLIYYIQLNKDNNLFKCCQNTNRIKWLLLKDILSTYIENLWGPELVEFSKLVQSSIIQQVCEYSLDEAFFYVPRDPPRNLEEFMLKSIHITEKDVERLYADFIDHCFPSFYQTIESFKCYMEKYGFEKSDNRLTLLFHAFNFYNNGFLSFHELLLGLATIEPNTVHGESRVRFIFRYYDVDNSGLLSLKQLKKMITDMYPRLSEEEVNQKHLEAINLIGTKEIDGQAKITADTFISAVGLHRFRGTSSLCRSSKSIFTQIFRTIAARTLKFLTVKHNIGSIVKPFKGSCITCKEKEYYLASHSVKINSQGFVVEPIQVIDKNQTCNGILTLEKYSFEFVFNKNSAANIMIRLIRHFNSIKGTNKEPKGLLADKPAILWKLIVALYSDLSSLLIFEKKCSRIISPCYIMGDIHGNLEDLLSLEKALWKRQPCVGANFLFLGDYVDRGQWGLECALYLMAFKLLMPNKVTILRGNHEVRSLQEYYTYKQECCDKYGESQGLKIWEITNKIFDKLPVSAVIDDAIFCAHGGIPKSTKLVNEITQIQSELEDPETESPIAWEILWSDPCHGQQFIEMCNFLKIDFKDTHGFLKNLKRGTAFQFNEFGAMAFLEQNGLTHIVRAHEVPIPGYMFHFGNKCTTIFSCSHYCGNNNDCACILVDDQVIRIINLDTVNNAPATD